MECPMPLNLKFELAAFAIRGNSKLVTFFRCSKCCSGDNVWNLNNAWNSKRLLNLKKKKSTSPLIAVSWVVRGVGCVQNSVFHQDTLGWHRLYKILVDNTESKRKVYTWNSIVSRLCFDIERAGSDFCGSQSSWQQRLGQCFLSGNHASLVKCYKNLNLGLDLINSIHNWQQ